MEMKEFLAQAVAHIFTWPRVEGVKVSLMPSFRFEDNGMDGMVVVWLTGADDLKCSCVISCEVVKFHQGDPAHHLRQLRRMVESVADDKVSA